MRTIGSLSLLILGVLAGCSLLGVEERREGPVATSPQSILRDARFASTIQSPSGRLQPLQFWTDRLFQDRIRWEWQPWPGHNEDANCIAMGRGRVGGTIYLMKREPLPQIDTAALRIKRSWFEEDYPAEELEIARFSSSTVTGETYTSFSLVQDIPPGHHIACLIVGRSSTMDRDVAIIGACYAFVAACNNVPLITVEDEQ